MGQKRVLITGASSGIGRECAELLHRNGYQVLGVSRNIQQKDFPYETRQLDVTDEAAVLEMMRDFEFDIAILNAGMGISGTIEDVSMELARKQMEVNYFANLNLSRIFVKKMREQGGGMIIIMSSIAGKVPLPMQGHYCSSKYALEAMAETLAMETAGYGIKVSLIEPGDTSTGFTDARIKVENSDSVYSDQVRKTVSKIEKDERHGDSPVAVAETVLKVLKMKNPPVRVAIGMDYKLLMFIMRFLPDKWRQFILRKMYL